MYMLKTDDWYLERLTYLIGGSMTLLSAVLAAFHSVYWLILTAFVGVNLIIFSLTGFCMMAIMLSKLGAKPRLCK
jgi:hypothetical protein